ncbi:surface antigen [Plasmodium falciparum UGT5.1]|uniref:Surface antigen n=1 Tax=Plasmodium falciparum UGT5.1 TaxID=1237627 RepID=W7J9D3_PLAFA|nr:surface antigen [Plasmodium falciparum UGT5.1]
MKRVMQQFVDRTTQRFHEYDERMKTTRQKCKDQCDKEIQKIILKDKLEKELMDKFATLQTDIQNDAIPTCVCEKSIADKTEKFCLNCGMNVGGGITLSSGVLGGIGAVAVNAWKDAAIIAAKAAAIAEGAAKGAVAGKARGMAIVIRALKEKGIAQYCTGIYQSILKIENFTDLKTFASAIIQEHNNICGIGVGNGAACEAFDLKLGVRLSGGGNGPPAGQLVRKLLDGLAYKAEQAAAHVTKTTSEKVTKAAIETSTGAIDAASTHLYSTIAYSITAILIIVLIMVIIYLILRYRRKKKMKKKLQYIKLLEE